MHTFFTSESVTAGHPDKLCDQIADAILDEALKYDSESHMAVEVTIKNEVVIIYGEANTKAKLDYAKIAKQVLTDVGYDANWVFNIIVTEQSSEINNAVSKDSNEIGAGDQGIMFGYACSETDEYMPAPIYYAHLLTRRLAAYGKDSNGMFGPDGKSQVTVEYEDGKPVRIDTIVISTQHSPDLLLEEVQKIIKKDVIDTVIPEKLVDENTKYLINPSGSFVLGGSFADSGTTGRKIVCDTYGGKGHIGGGCFSSKDPSKVDRTGAYYARYVAKNIVMHRLADEVEIQVAYAIGKPEPVSIHVDTFGTNNVSTTTIMEFINKNFDFSVANMIEELGLKNPIYREVCNYGHFGNPKYPWEQKKFCK
jgi:S-adenosylmethionine synthetase